MSLTDIIKSTVNFLPNQADKFIVGPVMDNGARIGSKIPIVNTGFRKVFRNGITDGLKTAGSKTRRTLDYAVSTASAVAILYGIEKIPGVAMQKPFFDFYQNNTDWAVGLTVGIPAAAASLVIPRVRNAVGTALSYSVYYGIGTPVNFVMDHPKIAATATGLLGAAGLGVALYMGASGPSKEDVEKVEGQVATLEKRVDDVPTITPQPTATLVPTATPQPIAILAPTPVPAPTSTPRPTYTPTPAPTATPQPTATPVPATPTPTPVVVAPEVPKIVYNGCTDAEATKNRPATPYYSSSPKDRVIDVTRNLLPDIKLATNATDTEFSKLEFTLNEAQKEGNTPFVFFAPNVSRDCTDMGVFALTPDQKVISGIYLKLPKSAADGLAPNYGMPSNLTNLTN